ncbi:MAG: glycosyltransferase family 4 protein [Clostridiales bacterium]|nr:glycosyltransferase family 4 protein [Clostridiales bacterium]
MTKTISNKILLITNIPTPYRIPLFNELYEQLKNKGLKLTVLFGAYCYPYRKWDVDLSSCNFDFRVLSSRHLMLLDNERVVFTYPGLINLVLRDEPRAVITNAFSPATTKLWLISWFKKIRYLIWSGAIESKGQPDSPIRKIHRKLLVRKAVGFIAYGTKAKDYLVNLGAKPEDIEIGINTVDIQFFRSRTKPSQGEIRKRWGTNGKKILLYVGYLVRRKRLDLLLKSIKILAAKRRDFVLKIVGDGPEREKMVDLSDRLNLQDLVIFEGYKQKDDLIEIYTEADCFLFPTEFDIWGLVLVEAMAAGLPCIVSIHAAATHDLIIDGVNGFAMDFADSIEVAKKIEMIMDNPHFARKIGEEARRLIEAKASLAKSAEGFVRAIERAL